MCWFVGMSVYLLKVLPQVSLYLSSSKPLPFKIFPCLENVFQLGQVPSVARLSHVGFPCVNELRRL